METGELTGILHRLLDRLDVLGEARIPASEAASWPGGVPEQLGGGGLVVEAGVGEGTACPGCEEACWIVPEVRVLRDGDRLYVHACDRRDDVGLVRLDFADLRSWRVDGGAVAAAVARGSGLGGSAEELLPRALWRIGTARAGRLRRTLLFAVGYSRWSADERRSRIARFGGTRPIVLVPAELPDVADDGVTVLPLTEVLDVDADGVLLDLEAVLAPEEEKPRRHRPVQVPEGTTWERVTIRIVDDEHIQIVCAGRIEPRSFAEMGMADTRRRPPAPDVAWAMLLALGRSGGSVAWSDGAASEDLRTKMKLLRGHLCNALGIEDDPFHRYEPRRGWRPRFVLVDLRGVP